MEHHALRGVHNLRSCSHWLHLTRTGVVSLHLVMGVVLSNRNRLVALDGLHRLLEVVVEHRVRLRNVLGTTDVLELHLQLHERLLLHLVDVKLGVWLLTLVHGLLAIKVFVVLNERLQVILLHAWRRDSLALALEVLGRVDRAHVLLSKH